MDTQRKSKIETRREQTVKYAKMSYLVACLILILNILFVIGAATYVASVRIAAQDEINVIHAELNTIRDTANKTKEFVQEHLAPNQLKLHERLDVLFDQIKEPE